VVFLFFSFLVILGFELRALCFLGRHSTTWVMLPAQKISFNSELLLTQENLLCWNTNYVGWSAHVFFPLPFFPIFTHESLCWCQCENGGVAGPVIILGSIILFISDARKMCRPLESAVTPTNNLTQTHCVLVHFPSGTLVPQCLAMLPDEFVLV
jgi:hypothetical protein